MGAKKADIHFILVELLKDKQDLEQKDSKSYTAVERAISSKNFKAAVILIMFGADLSNIRKDIVNKLNEDPQLQQLIMQRQQLSIQQAEIDNSLFEAIQSGNKVAVAGAVSLGANIISIKIQNKVPAIYAAEIGYGDIAKFLALKTIRLLFTRLTANLDLLKEDLDMILGCLHMGFEPVITVPCLLELLKIAKVNLNEPFFFDYSILHIAAEFGYNDFVLAEIGNKEWHEDLKEEGLTLLIAATKGNNLELVNQLLPNYPNSDRKYKGKTALEIADEEGYEDIFNTLTWSQVSHHRNTPMGQP